MKKNDLLTVQLDDQGHLILPPEIMRQYGLESGAVIRLQQAENELIFTRSTASLARVYIEPTNVCNLGCRTCMRNVWNGPLGYMDQVSFSAILQGIQAFSPRPMVFFGGLGEPLTHPHILDMIAAVRQLGARVELISNATLLTEITAARLVELDLNRLWVSIDGATPETYADVRLGDTLPLVQANLRRLQEFRQCSETNQPKLGIAFVAMKCNIADLPEVIRMGKLLGADRFSISNVLPHTAELRQQVLFEGSMFESGLQPTRWAPRVSLPRLDPTLVIFDGLRDIAKGRNSFEIVRQSPGMGASSCPFLEKGSLSIRWDGAVSPCLPLLHTHQCYLGENLRTNHAYIVGNIRERSLQDIWQDPQYLRLRQRLQSFDYSPCVYCNSCDMAEANLEDCFGNVHPACGGCLWAQGFIQCP